MCSGAAQFVLVMLALIAQFKSYFIARSQQMAPHMGGVNSTGAAVVTALVVLEFLFQPLSFFLLYLALEGAVRFLGSLVTAEIVPSLLVFLFFRISDSTSRSVRRRRQGPALADAVEWLANDRIRIASASAKAGWNSSITIGIAGKWFEIEREEHAQPPHAYMYVLRPVPPGKILRGYQEYEAPAPHAVATNTQDAK